MDNRAIRTTDGAKEIIEYNRQVLYHLPSKYKYLELALRNTKKDLLKILKDIYSIDPIIWKQKYVWYLDNNKLTRKIRKVGACSTSSRHFNYLCAVGVLEKIPQYDGHMIGINEEFLLETGRKRPINVFSIHRYTDKKLEEIEERAKLLFEKKVTCGNISKDKLVAAGLPELAKHIFFWNEEKSYDKKERAFKRLLTALEEHISQKGYATMQDLAKSLNMSQENVRELNKIFKLQMEERYCYKAPNKEIMEQLDIKTKKWIFTRR